MKCEMTGRRFGNLTVIQEVPGKNSGKKYWQCKCQCGKTTIVEDSHLKSGHTKSCGCYRKNRHKSRVIDITGERYGRLVALEPADKTDASLKFWLCQCDCGKQCICAKSNLRTGITKSCGCLQEEQRKENMKKAIHFVEGTCVERIACRKTFSNNVTGHRGVSYRKECRKWRASIGFQGKLYYLGTFARYEDAVKARLDAEERLYDPFLEKLGKKMVQDE